MKHYTCTKCKQSKPEKDFPKKWQKKGCYFRYCGVCTKEHAAEGKARFSQEDIELAINGFNEDGVVN